MSRKSRVAALLVLAGVLAEDRRVAEFFDAAVSAGGDPKAMANWLINDLFAFMNDKKQTIDQIKVLPHGLVELGGLVADQTINRSTAVKVLAEMCTSGKEAGAIVAERGLAQISG